jgi:hypothetical protein
MNALAGITEERLGRAGRLLESAGLRPPFCWTPLVGGANNQVFRIDASGRTVLLKAYFVHPDDPRDRLRAEYGFSCFAWANGVRALAQPLACDPTGQLAVFEFLPGRKLVPAEVTRARMYEALNFFLAVNSWTDPAQARALPVASEACFSFEEHLHCVRRRVARLQALPVAGPVDQEALAFVQQELAPAAESVLANAGGLTQPLPATDRCLSPSDFGFHNALLTEDGQVRFIDFEYAGWDDPAKMVADFFCQPACPVPEGLFDEFARAVAERTTNPGFHLHRFRLLLPVYRVKWCAILLNDFLPAGGHRRRFAVGSEDEHERKVRQLEKARTALQKVLTRNAESGPSPSREVA